MTLRKTKITEMNRLDKASFDASDKIPLTIVLDNVRSMNNVGSVFRTADAFRLERIILCGITARPPHPDIHIYLSPSAHWQTLCIFLNLLLLS